jgi:tRNA dimethylallyltransferase
MQEPFFIIIAGPTGVGKTALVHDLVGKLPFPFEVINADMGQMYASLTIGTAKPDYLHEPVKHHLFDCINEPKDITVAQYRERVIGIMNELWKRSVIPVLVGGSGFYVSSLFFPPLDVSGTNAERPNTLETYNTAELYKKLQEIDPARAAAIHPHDRYRIERALALWYYSGIVPSACVPAFNSPGRCFWFFLTRERTELAQRINQRVDKMFEQGWIEEVAQLDDAWKAFLLTKKIIGYREIIEFLEGQEVAVTSSSRDTIDSPYRASQSLQPSPKGYGGQVGMNGVAVGGSQQRLLELMTLKETIAGKTRAYAKRQLTYWRMLQKKFEQCDPEHGVKLIEINLSQEEGWNSIVNQLK